MCVCKVGTEAQCEQAFLLLLLLLLLLLIHTTTCVPTTSILLLTLIWTVFFFSELLSLISFILFLQPALASSPQSYILSITTPYVPRGWGVGGDAYSDANTATLQLFDAWLAFSTCFQSSCQADLTSSWLYLLYRHMRVPSIFSRKS